MSSIDKYWSDRLIYHIGFIANVSKTNSLVEKKEFHRTFIFPSSLTEIEIKGATPNKFAFTVHCFGIQTNNII